MHARRLRVGRNSMLGALAAVALMFALPAGASAQLASTATPYMGWNTYYGVGGVFDESTVKSVASSLISSGLAQAGYKIVWLDFGWATGARDSNGNLIVDATQWPDGMAGLTAWLHQQGLQAGIYTDAGTTGCSGQGVGSHGHYQQDANQFAAWGFDAVKVDFCGAGQEGLSSQVGSLYGQFSQALANNTSGRPMILNVDNFWVPGQINGTDPSLAESSYGNYAWAPQLAQSWRTDTDIGGHRSIVFTNVLRNLDHDAAQPGAAGPPGSSGIAWGHWNDPDYLGPELGMTSAEAQSQFSMWAMLAAPLILGSDPRVLSSTSISMLKNASVIAVDQDSLGAQGTLLSQSGSGQVWGKPLAGGARAVALFNRGTSPLQITTSASAVGLPGAADYQLQDLWSGETSTTSGTITALVPAHAVALYRVTSEPSATLTVRLAGSDSGTVTGSNITCPGTCTATYAPGTIVTLTAAPAAGSTFAGWSGACGGTGPCIVSMSSDQSVTATFTASQTASPTQQSPSPVQTSTGAATGTTVSCAYQLAGPAAFRDVCTAAVSNGTSHAPLGVVQFTSSAGGSFPAGSACAPAQSPGTPSASCSVQFIPPPTASPLIAAYYQGNSQNNPSAGSTARLLFQNTAKLIPSASISPSTIRAAVSGGPCRSLRPAVGCAAAAHSAGGKVKLTLRAPAVVEFTVQLPSPGRKDGKSRCVKPTRANQKRGACTRWVALAGNFKITASTAGSDGFRFRGRIGGKKLNPGGYRLVATPFVAAVAQLPTYIRFRVR
jgi:hypothetical protein